MGSIRSLLYSAKQFIYTYISHFNIELIKLRLTEKEDPKVLRIEGKVNKK